MNAGRATDNDGELSRRAGLANRRDRGERGRPSAAGGVPLFAHFPWDRFVPPSLHIRSQGSQILEGSG